MIIPAIIGYLCGNFQFGLLVATGTLAHIYVFKGPSRSKLRTVIICNLAFAICMILGTLTATTPLVFGMTLLIVTVIPFYIFTALKIAGPSSTFFIVTFSLPINLPIAPEEALYRGFAILVGGVLATMMVLITILLSKNKAEEQAIQNDFKLISKLLHAYNDKSAFSQVAKTAVDSFKASDKLLITSNSSSDKLSGRFQKLLLLHTSAQGIYSELLELNAKQIRPLPDELIEMMDHIITQRDDRNKNVRYWRKEVTVTEEFQNLFNHILKIDEMVHANEARIAYEAEMRKPLYSKRIYQNLTLDSIVFRNTLRYAAIMMIAIFIALMFDFEKAYWIPLSAHTVLLGTSTIHAIERGIARGLGTILGVLVLSVILLFSIPTPVAVILMGIAAELRLGIVNGHIAEGTLLTENQMAKQFNVSRSPIRDAFKLLQQNQLIQLERMGAHVLPFGEQEKKEMYDLRLMLESFAFSRVKNQERLPIVKEMKKQLEMMKVAVKFEDAESFTKHDFEFHETLIKASNHQYLNSFWSHLKPVMMALVLTSMRQRMQQNPQDFERIHHNHQVFIDAVEQYDSQILKEAFHLNFDDVGKDIEGFWLN